MRAKVAEKRKHHHEIKQDTYCGKFLVRGSLNRSPLDKVIFSSSGQTRPKLDPTKRYLSGFKHLQRFYELTKNTKPLAIHRQRCSAFFIDNWIIVLCCGFYVSISKSPDGLKGAHPAVLYYSHGPYQNYAIASTVYEEHFTQQHDRKLPDFIRHLRMTKGFFQSQDAAQQQIPF